MSEQVKTAGESLGQDIVSEDAESAVGEVAADQDVAAAGNAEAAAAGVDEAPEGEAADEPTEEELAAARELAENNALADVFDDVRKQSADSHLVTPERWPEIGLVPEHMTAEDFEMFVYEWLEDYQAEHKEEIEAERAAERAKAAAVRSATRAVGVPPKIPNRRLEQIEADNEAKAAEAADKAPEAVEDSVEAESAAGVDASAQVDNAAKAAESAAVAATPAVSEPAPGSPDDAAEDDQPAEDDRSPFAGRRIPEGYRLEQIEGEWVLVEDENAAPVRKEIKCNRIKVLMGMHSYYLYDETLMTASYARWAFLAAEDNPVVTFVECVRVPATLCRRVPEEPALPHDRRADRGNVADRARFRQLSGHRAHRGIQRRRVLLFHAVP